MGELFRILRKFGVAKRVFAYIGLLGILSLSGLRERLLWGRTARTTAATIQKMAAKGAGRAIASGTLEDFDWSLRLCMGSDQLATLRQPVLLLSLTVASSSAGGAAPAVTTLELSPDELDHMLASMGRIEEVISSIV